MQKDESFYLLHLVVDSSFMCCVVLGSRGIKARCSVWCGKLSGRFMCQSIYRNKQTDRHGKARHAWEGGDKRHFWRQCSYIQVCMCVCVCGWGEVRGGAGGESDVPSLERGQIRGKKVGSRVSTCLEGCSFLPSIPHPSPLKHHREVSVTKRGVIVIL